MKACLIYIIIFAFAFSIHAQVQNESKDSIIDHPFIMNPSFEAFPQRGIIESETIIKHWKDCSTFLFPNSPGVDVHGIQTNYWEVSDRPSDGDSYIGMVARENEKWESLQQELTKPIEPNNTYQFDIDVKLDNNLESITESLKSKQRFDNPLTLRVFLTNEYCVTDTLVHSSFPIDNLEWETLQIQFTSDRDYRYIVLEAFYELPVKSPYNGNIMIDNIRNMRIISR